MTFQIILSVYVFLVVQSKPDNCKNRIIAIIYKAAKYYLYVNLPGELYQAQDDDNKDTPVFTYASM
jgi:hypothetical protein